MNHRIFAASALAATSALLFAGEAEAHLAGTIYSPVYRHIASYDCTGIFTDLPNLNETSAQFECEATVTAYDVLCEDTCGKVKRINRRDECISQVASVAITSNEVICGDDEEDEGDRECRDDDRGARKAKLKHERGGHDDHDRDCVEVCHVPKGNPENAHTICVDDKAARTHVKKHGDSLGPCEDSCVATETMMLPQTVKDEATSVCSDLGDKWSFKDELVKSVQVRLKSFECFGEGCVEKEQAFEAVLDCKLPRKFDIVKNPPPGDGDATPYDCTVVAEAHCDQGEECPIQVENVCGDIIL